MKRPLGPLALLALTCACGNTRLIDGFTEGVTRIRLAPSEFTGSVICRRDTPAALQQYMVRFQLLNPNIEGDAGLTTAAASGPIPCDQAALFTPVAGRFYGAEVFGFDRAIGAADLDDPAGARWTASCGRGALTLSPDAGRDPLEPTYAVTGVTVQMRGCTSFDGGALGAGSTQLAVDAASALGTLGCGDGSGKVASLSATLDGVTRGAACGSPLLFELPPIERYYTIELTGFELAGDAGAGAPDAQAPSPPSPDLDAGLDASADSLDASVSPAPTPGQGVGAGDAGDAGTVVRGVARWRTQCIGHALPGLRVPAFCDPFVRLP